MNRQPTDGKNRINSRFVGAITSHLDFTTSFPISMTQTILWVATQLKSLEFAGERHTGQTQSVAPSDYSGNNR